MGRLNPMDLAQKKLYCEVVAQLLIVNASLKDEERTFLEQLMNRLGLDAQAKQDVINHVNFGDPVGEKVLRLEPAARASLVEDLRSASLVDGDLAPRKARFIAKVQSALEDSSSASRAGL